MPIYRTPKRGLSYSEGLTEAYASAPDDALIHDTLELIHPGFRNEFDEVVTVRVVNEEEEILATLEADAPVDAGVEVKFLPVRFTIKRPAESDTGGVNEMDLSISNVSRKLMPYLDQVKESRVPIQCIYRPYLQSDTSAPHMNPPLRATLRSVSMTMLVVTAKIGFGNLINRRFPRVDYTPDTHPGLAS